MATPVCAQRLRVHGISKPITPGSTSRTPARTAAPCAEGHRRPARSHLAIGQRHPRSAPASQGGALAPGSARAARLRLACGYADCNDAARLVDDPIHKLLLERDPLDGAALGRSRRSRGSRTR